MTVNKKQQSTTGSALLIALLVMVGVVAVSAATAQVVLNEVKQASAIDKATTAYYAAETGGEKALFYIRQQQTDPLFFNGYHESLATELNYFLSVDTTESAIYTAIKKDQSEQINLYGNGDLLSSADIASVKLICHGQSNALLEVSWVSWQTDGSLGQPKQADGPVNCANGGYLINLGNSSNNMFFTLRLTARFADVDDLQILAYNQVNEPISIPNNIVIKSTGSLPGVGSNINQSVIINLPLRPPILGVLDPVIFSQESLEKNYE
jgi:FlaG/FlaF family flagellin (archaellin)